MMTNWLEIEEYEQHLRGGDVCAKQFLLRNVSASVLKNSPHGYQRRNALMQIPHYQDEEF